MKWVNIWIRHGLRNRLRECDIFVYRIFCSTCPIMWICQRSGGLNILPFFSMIAQIKKKCWKNRLNERFWWLKMSKKLIFVNVVVCKFIAHDTIKIELLKLEQIFRKNLHQFSSLTGHDMNNFFWIFYWNLCNLPHYILLHFSSVLITDNGAKIAIKHCSNFPLSILTINTFD